MIKYEALTRPGRIYTVEVDRETKHSVWINGRRHAKVSEFLSYHDTWEGARTYMLQVAANKVRLRASALERAEAEVEAIYAMKPPSAEGEA